MTEPATQESYPVPDPSIVDPCPATVRNGQCPPDGFTNNHHQQAKPPSQPEPFTTGQEMKITDSVEGEGNFIYVCLVWMWFLKVMDMHVCECAYVEGTLGRWRWYFYPCEVFLVPSYLNN